MKRILLPLCLAAAFTCALPAGAENARMGFDIRFGGIAFTEDEYYKDEVGGGIEAGLVFWSADRIMGLWVGGGVQGATLLWHDSWSDLESDIYSIPVGASLLVRGEILPGVALKAEGGARYAFLDVDDDDDYHDYHHSRRHSDMDRYYHPEEHLDIDDTVFAIATLSLEFDLDPLVLGFGGGYQFDLDKPDMKYDGETVGELDFSGALFFVNLGLVF